MRKAATIVVAVLGGLVAAGLPAGSQAVMSVPELRHYRVLHSTYGEIGTYTNRIEATGAATTVSTDVHIKVSVLGIVLHREDAHRVERWAGGRLVSFVGNTVENGKNTEVSGEAQGDGFVIHSPHGVIVAPAQIHPANPWAPNFLDSTVMMRVDTGAVEPVHVSGGDAAPVQVDGTTLPAREFEIDGQTRYRVWLDAGGVPVKFSVDRGDATVSFLLTR